MLHKYILAQIKEWIQRNSFISTTTDCEGNTILGDSGAKKTPVRLKNWSSMKTWMNFEFVLLRLSETPSERKTVFMWEFISNSK